MCDVIMTEAFECWLFLKLNKTKEDYYSMSKREQIILYQAYIINV